MTVRPQILAVSAAVLASLLPVRVGADAIVWSQAMLAPTIAEIFVEDDRVRVELEIGEADLDAFRNLLPDELYEQLGHPATPWSDRLERFFANDFVIVGDDGPPLVGRIVEMSLRPRIRRDEVTGEALPAGEIEAVTVFVRLEYPLKEMPASLTFLGLRGPKPAGIGFVVYHNGVPVNDFRYLSPAQTLELDWDDPWYSHFSRRSLRRQYFAPMSGFLYVELYEVRKEIIARPRDLQSFVDLGLAGRETIPIDMQAELKRKVAAFLREHHTVTIDGRTIQPELAQVNFLERSLRTSRVIDPPVELDLDAAMLGVIFVYPTDGLPQHVTMDWDLWNERIRQIPVSAVDQAGPLPSILEPDWHVLEWTNFLKNPELPTLAVIAPPASAWARGLWRARWLLVAAAGVGLAMCLRGWQRGASPRRLAATASLLLLLTLGLLAWGRGAAVSPDRFEQLVSNLLHNVYRAFDYRAEEQIYDVLARTVQGDLLERIYLETQRGLELVNQGGARAKVKDIELIELEAVPGEDGGFVAEATWVVRGSVGHWGHLHERTNRYRAELDVRPVDGAWKIAGLELLQEERL